MTSIVFPAISYDSAGKTMDNSMLRPIERIAKIYEDDPLIKIIYSEDKKNILKELRQIQDIELFDYSLSSFSKLNPMVKKPLISLFLRMGSDRIRTHFGSNAVAWHRINYNRFTGRIKLKDHDHDVTLDQYQLLENATNCVLKHIGPKNENAAKIIRSMSASHEQVLKEIGLQSILSGYGIKNPISSKYSLSAGIADIVDSNGGGFDQKYRHKGLHELQDQENFLIGIYMKTSLGIVLKYDAKPMAIVSLLPINVNTLAVYEPHIVTPIVVDNDHNKLSSLETHGEFNNWRNAMKDITKEFSKILDFKCTYELH